MPLSESLTAVPRWQPAASPIRPQPRPQSEERPCMTDGYLWKWFAYTHGPDGKGSPMLANLTIIIRCFIGGCGGVEVERRRGLTAGWWEGGSDSFMFNNAALQTLNYNGIEILLPSISQYLLCGLWMMNYDELWVSCRGTPKPLCSATDTMTNTSVQINRALHLLVPNRLHLFVLN